MLVHRESLGACYRRNITAFMRNVYSMSEADASAEVAHMASTEVVDRKVKTQIVGDDGDVTVKEGMSLLKWIDRGRKFVVTPNGGMFVPVDARQSIVGVYIKELKEARDYHKRKKLEMLGKGDKAGVIKHHQLQGAKKVLVNALPGGYGNPYNIFADKVCYNAITSMARSLIATSYTIAEQLLGGNFPWFTEDDAINYIVINVMRCPDEDVMTRVLSKYGLQMKSHVDLYRKMTSTISQYQLRQLSFPALRDTIASLHPRQVTYIYYLGDLFSLITDGGSVTRGMIDACFAYGVPAEEPIVPTDLYTLDADLMATVSPTFYQEYGAELKKLQPYDLPKAAPQKAVEYIHRARHTEQKLGQFQELWDIFIATEINVATPNRNKAMFRKITIVSDTDSVIFTVGNWIEWYCGEAVINADAYRIACLTIYWLTKAVDLELRKWSVKYGFTGSASELMKMKNEFFYPVILICDLKKTYGALNTMTEGVVLPFPVPDVKGNNLKGKNMCKESSDFCHELLVEDILKPALKGKISGSDLLAKVAARERHIIASLRACSPEYLLYDTFNQRNNYQRPESDYHYLAWFAWETVFGKKHGTLNPPLKAPIIPLLLTDRYLDVCGDETVAAGFREVKRVIGKHPNFIAFNPAAGLIPVELLGVMDIRKIVWANLGPAYLLLKTLGVFCPPDKQILLVSDVY